MLSVFAERYSYICPDIAKEFNKYDSVFIKLTAYL